MLKIFFMFPILTEFGGVQNLIINMAVSLSSIKGIDVNILDYSEGVVCTELQKIGNARINIINIDSYVMLDTLVTNNDLIVGFTKDIINFPNYFRSSSPRVIIWDVYHPYWSSLFKIKGRYMIPPLLKYKKQILNMALIKRSFVFMDSLGASEVLKITENKNEELYSIVKLPINNIAYMYNRKGSLNTIHIGYVGRAVFFKIAPVIKILNDLSVSNGGYIFVFHIVTNNISLFKKELGEYCNITVCFYDDVVRNKLEYLLLEKIDLLFAMGTSALEGAKFGVPTILADFIPNTEDGYQAFPSDYKYRWIFDSTKEGDVGEDLSIVEKAEYKCNPISSTIYEKILELESNKIGISLKCYQYVADNHSLDNATKRLVEIIMSSSLEISDLKRYRVIRIFYIKEHIMSHIRYFLKNRRIKRRFEILSLMHNVRW